MKLQILVPQYHETEEVISGLLNSIAVQRVNTFEDFEVIIVSDGGEVILSPEFLASYPFAIKYIINEHKGVSATRNRALDAATADYVMFCDADDCFFTLAGLVQILDNSDQKYDVLESNFIQEIHQPNGVTTFAKIDKSNNAATFIHGKVYRRQFLVDNNIRWDDELTCHEDGYFNALVLNIAEPENKRFCEDPFYMWCDNPQSVTRKDPFFYVKTYDLLIKSQDHLIQEYLRRDRHDLAAFTFAHHFFKAFFLFVSTYREVERLIPYFNYLQKIVNDFYERNKELWESITYDLRDNIYEEEKKVAQMMGYYKDEVGFYNWFNTNFKK